MISSWCPYPPGRSLFFTHLCVTCVTLTYPCVPQRQGLEPEGRKWMGTKELHLYPHPLPHTCIFSLFFLLRLLFCVSKCRGRIDIANVLLSLHLQPAWNLTYHSPSPLLCTSNRVFSQLNSINPRIHLFLLFKAGHSSLAFDPYLFLAMVIRTVHSSFKVSLTISPPFIPLGSTKSCQGKPECMEQELGARWEMGGLRGKCPSLSPLPFLSSFLPWFFSSTNPSFLRNSSSLLCWPFLACVFTTFRKKLFYITTWNIYLYINIFNRNSYVKHSWVVLCTYWYFLFHSTSLRGKKPWSQLKNLIL